MQPEKGDPAIVVTTADVAAAVTAVGVVPGDTVMFHSSLSSMGTVVGGPDTVIDGFVEAAGATGTVAVPTLCNWLPGDEELVFTRWDPATSPSYVGAITEAMRRRRGARRSDHATHSVAAVGMRAEELTAGHGAHGERLGPFGAKAFAVASPWQRFVDWNAAYCFVGVSFRVNTMVHFVESLIVEHIIESAAPGKREAIAAAITGWMKPGLWPYISIDDREEIERLLAARDLVTYGKVGSATLRLARARPMVEGWLQIVEAEPERWLPAGFRAGLVAIAG